MKCDYLSAFRLRTVSIWKNAIHEENKLVKNDHVNSYRVDVLIQKHQTTITVKCILCK